MMPNLMDAYICIHVRHFKAQKFSLTATFTYMCQNQVFQDDSYVEYVQFDQKCNEISCNFTCTCVRASGKTLIFCVRITKQSTLICT